MSSCETPGTDSVRRAEVQLLGTFDISNFGDALFPLLAQWRLRETGVGVVPLSPTSGQPVWADSLPSRGLTDIRQPQTDRRCPLVILGGGDVVHLRPTPTGFYDDHAFSRWTAYPALWAGASLLATARGCAVAWNAPGVPEPLPDDLDPFFVAPENPLTYLTVRDELSRKHLPPQARSRALVVPDTLVETSRMWPASEVRSAIPDLFMRETGSPPPDRYLAIHVNNFATPDDTAGDMAAALDQWCRTWRADAVFVCPGVVHQDERWIDPVRDLMKSPSRAISRTKTLRELTAVLSGSVAYAGSSMHGFIISSSYGVPALAVMPPTNPAHVKLRGHIDLTGWNTPRLVETWCDLNVKTDSRISDPDGPMIRESAAYLELLTPALDRHWQHIIGLIESNASDSLHRHRHQSWLESLPPWAPVGEQILARISGEAALDAAPLIEKLEHWKQKHADEKERRTKHQQRAENLRSELDRHRHSLAGRLTRPLFKLERWLRGNP